MKHRLFKYAAYTTAPALLVGVAAYYTYLVEFDHYDRGWKGANFDMFATVDGPSTRVPHCWRLGPDGESHVACPDAVMPYIRHANRVPSPERMTRATARLTRHLRTRTDGPVDGARLELWEFDYRPEPPELVVRKKYTRTWREETDE